MGQSGSILIMGVGNELRNDDRVGLVLARSLRATVSPGVRVIEAGGDATAWLRHWADAEFVILLDATLTGAPPGTLTCCDLGRSQVDVPRSASTHGLGLGHIIELARAMGRLPTWLHIVGIEGADFGFGTTLSSPVRAALPNALRSVHQLLNDHRCALLTRADVILTSVEGSHAAATRASRGIQPDAPTSVGIT